MTRYATLCTLLGAILLSACGGDRPPLLSRDELLRPETCKECHPDHFREWSGSMHAYAADDPVFLAMNQRGQRETQGALGDFCVNCHAPMAVAEGLTTDGLNLDQLPQHLKGVTCYFCHSVDAVGDTHNNPLNLADDLVMRGGISDPSKKAPHQSAYSPLHDRTRFESSSMCGSCHDIVTPAGVHLERTFLEWKESLFAQTDQPGTLLTCSQCHMTGREGLVAQVDGVFLRRVHEHTFAGIDTALIPWPEKDAQLLAIKRDLDPSLQPLLCVEPIGGGIAIRATLDNVLVGHMWPSGAAQDRRAWLELVVYQGNTIVYSSGLVADGEAVLGRNDPDLWVLRDRLLDDQQNEVHMFWEAASVESELLPPAVTNDINDPRYFHAVTKVYNVLGPLPTRITMRARIRQMGLDVLDDLVQSGDLDPSVADAMPTLTLAGTEVTWSSGLFGCVP